MDRRAAGGGLGEYYCEGDTRAPTWIVAGDATRVAKLTGLSPAAVAGGFVDGEAATAWLDDGIAPNGAGGRAFSKGSVHGFDLTFAAPKSVSLLRALTTDVNDKVVAEAHLRAVDAAMDYLHQHAGYTRGHNQATGKKDLRRLPGLVGIAYQHETSRCGDPHLHTHVIVPNRQARADGTLVSIDSKSLRRLRSLSQRGTIGSRPWCSPIRRSLAGRVAFRLPHRHPADRRTGADHLPPRILRLIEPGYWCPEHRPCAAE